jgi:glucose-1-phosphate cytidylyltransferase
VKVVLFCGGQGLRLRAASSRVPKPLITVGGEPLLLHLMRYYAHWGHTEFILCLGHRARAFEAYFSRHAVEDWQITFADTGLHSNIGERLRRVRHLLDGEEYFLANYGDQLSDAPLEPRIERLRREDKVASLLSVRPRLSTHFVESDDDGHVSAVGSLHDLWINGGFHIYRHDVFDYMREGEELVEEPFRRLIAARQLVADRYEGFWAPMDTLKDKNLLDSLAESPAAPWAVWLRDAAERPVAAA